MNCTKCGKEIPDGENKVCDECKKTLLDELNKEEEKVESKKKTKKESKEDKEESKKENKKDLEESKKEDKKETKKESKKKDESKLEEKKTSDKKDSKEEKNDSKKEDKESKKTEKKNGEKKNDKKEDKKEDSKAKSNLPKIIVSVLVCLIVIFLSVGALEQKGVIDVLPFTKSNSVGNSIANIRNYGYTAFEGDTVYYIAPSLNDMSKIAIYKSKEDGTENQMIFEGDEGSSILGLNVYKNYIYYIKISKDNLTTNTSLTESGDSKDILNNKICRISLKDENPKEEILNDNEFNNNCYEIYVLDNKIYYIDANEENIYYMNLDGTGKTKLNDDMTGYLGFTNKKIILNVVKEKEEKNEQENISVANTTNTAETTSADNTTQTENTTTSEEKTVQKEFVTISMDLNGENRKELTGERLYSVNVVNNTVYFVNKEQEVLKVDIDGKKEEELIAQGVGAYNMNVTDKYIFYMNYTDEAKNKIGIYRMDLNGENKIQIYTLETFSSYLNVVDNHVVFMDTSSITGDVTVNMIDKDGQNKVVLYSTKNSVIKSDNSNKESTTQNNADSQATQTENTTKE